MKDKIIWGKLEVAPVDDKMRELVWDGLITYKKAHKCNTEKNWLFRGYRYFKGKKGLKKIWINFGQNPYQLIYKITLNLIE